MAPSRRTALVAVVLVALLAAAPIEAKKKSKNKGIGPFKFVEVTTTANQVPQAVGETFVVTGKIALANDVNDVVVGTSTVTGIAISVDTDEPQANAYLTITLDAGIITAQGIGVFAPGVPVNFAITGGTGSYVGLSGTLTATIDADPAKARLVITASNMAKKG